MEVYMSFGQKHRNVPISQLPFNYANWLLENCISELSPLEQDELTRRVAKGDTVVSLPTKHVLLEQRVTKLEYDCQSLQRKCDDLSLNIEEIVKWIRAKKSTKGAG